jgi:hypothetical protein
MIDTHRVHKHVMIKGIYGIEKVEEKVPHISVMLAHSCGGTRVPPFVIVPKLIQMKSDISELLTSHDAWIVSSPSGWETRETFFIWSVFFCHWTQEYRRRLPDWMSESPMLLILDGHSSRGCPAALQLFKKFNIEVLVLPSHTSHILQMFGVGLAANFKRVISESLKRKSAYAMTHWPENSARLRWSAISAAIHAMGTVGVC